MSLPPPSDPGDSTPPRPRVEPGRQRNPGGAPALGSLLVLGLAAVASFALGWLGYQWVRSLGGASGDDSAGVVSLLERGGSRAGSAPSPSGAQGPSGRPLDRPAVAMDRNVPLVSLQCLAGGRGEIAARADASNFGPRLTRDWRGRPVPSTPSLIVLHETVVDERTALSLFQRRNGDDAQQASYHVLIGRDGRRLRVVPDDQRAYGAGDSAFDGLELQLRPGLKPSVNNVALHVSLVSPPDGADGEARSHSGYTAEQYRSLASQIALWKASYGLPATRVVTHQEVDRSGSRRDPRSFDWRHLGKDLRSVWLSCGGSAPLADLGR